MKKTQRCMEVIIDAKERQAAEANKNATILLQEIDLEKVIFALIVHYFVNLIILNRNTRRIAELLLPVRERKRSERKKRKSEKIEITSSILYYHRSGLIATCEFF